MTHLQSFFKTVCFFVLIFSFSCQSKHQSPITTANYRENLLDSLLNAAIHNREIPGAVAYIERNGQTVYHKAFGMKNMEKQSPMKANDIFRMASMTKGITAVGVLQLKERGLIDLDDEISKYIPEFKNPRVLVEVLADSSFSSRPAKNEITIRQLLTHTSGIGYGFQDDRYNKLILKNNICEGFGNDDRTSIENIRKIASLPLLHEPGETYTYGLSYDVLGVLIETVSGMRYDKYITQNILKPLGMKNSYFIVPEQERKRLVEVYQPGQNGTALESTEYPFNDFPTLNKRLSFSGGADLCSTAEDYAKFVQMVLNKGVYNNTRIIGERYIEMMLSKQTKLDDGGSDQGFATWVTNKYGAAQGPMSIGSFGFGGFYDTYSWADPKENYVAVLLLQMYPNNNYKIHEKFQAITYGVINDLN